MPRATAEFGDRDVQSAPIATAMTPPRKPSGTPSRNATESMSPTFCPSIAGSSAPTTPMNPATSAVRHHQRETVRAGNARSVGGGSDGGDHACCSGAGNGEPSALTVSRDAIADPCRCSHCVPQHQPNARVEGQRNVAGNEQVQQTTLAIRAAGERFDRPGEIAAREVSFSSPVRRTLVGQ